MSILGGLKYELASAGYSEEQIQEVEQSVIMGGIVCGSIEQFAYDFLVVFRAYHSFGRAITQLVNQAGSSQAEVEQLSQGILQLAEETPKPKQKMPYYRKDKAQWWKQEKRT